MKVNKLTKMEWLKEHIKQLEVTTTQFNETTKEIIKINPDIYNEFMAWTPLKLVLLNYALDVCSSIISTHIKNKKVFEKAYYVDLFAGSGINKIKNQRDFLMGSPLISSLKYSSRFDNLFFCENNEDFFSALNNRIVFLKDKKLIVSKGDCNSLLDTIIKRINDPKAYSFIFVDPHSTEFSWDSMKKILILRSDIIFTLMTSEILRSIGLCRKGKSDGEYLTKFFGDNNWKNIKNSEDLINVYNENIKKIRSNAVVRTIKIKSKKFGFCYHLFFITRNTVNGCPWIKAIEKAREEIESNSDKSVEMAIELIKKRQSTLP